MVILEVGGVALPNPSSFTVDIMDLSSEDTGRTLSGKMTKDVIARKTKLNCSWNTLTWAQVSTILQAVESNIFLSVRYPDPKVGNFITKTFYVGDRSAPALMLSDGKKLWNGVSFEFIEQ